MFGYNDFFAQSSKLIQAKDPSEIENDKPDFIQFTNQFSLENSIKLLTDEDVTSIYMNYPALLLRKKSSLYPEGRTSHRFKAELRRHVTVLDTDHNVVNTPG